MEMRVFLFLLFVVGCLGIEWKVLNNFKKTFKRYSKASTDTISSIENILNASRHESDIFFNISFSNNAEVKEIIKLKSRNDTCVAKLADKNRLESNFKKEIHQFKIPLQKRLIEIRMKIKKIKTSIDDYVRTARSKIQTCKSLHKNCAVETGELFKSNIHSLSCDIFRNCEINSTTAHHSIRKREICRPHQFRCQLGQCIKRNSFCNGKCDCGDCSDEPIGCIKHCTEFRCRENFHCVSNSKKCNGIDDCGDGTDEERCQPTTAALKILHRHANCTFGAGMFLCNNKKCINQQQVCDGNNNCGDGSDEGDRCKGIQCSAKCVRRGGVCLVTKKRSYCLYECPPKTFETSKGCSLTPEAPFTTLFQLLDDTPRLKKRYEGRLKHLKTKTKKKISKSLEEVIKCRREELRALSVRGNHNIAIEKPGSYMGHALTSKRTTEEVQ